MNGPFDPRVDPQLLDRIIRGKLFDSSQYHDQLNLNGAQVVVAATPANGDVLTYDTPLGQWVNKPIGVLTGVSSVTAANGTLTIAPTVGNVLASLNLGNANTWTALQTFGNNISLGGAQLAVAGLTNGDLLQYNGANWVNVAFSSITGTLIGATKGTPLALTALGAGAAGISSVGGVTTVTGALDTFLGFNAGHVATTATLNVGVGAYALLALTTGSNNTVVGYQAGQAITTGTDVTAIGYQAASSNTSNFITAVGSGALSNNVVGTANTAVGYFALNANTGSSNTAMGYVCLQSNTSGVNNSAFGSGAMMNNTTGEQSVAVGTNALVTNTTGSFNTAVGFQALNLNSTGSYNTAVGVSALYHSTAGTNNAFGYLALYSLTTGTPNDAFGYQALYSLTTGYSNVAIGYQAGYSMSSGTDNTTVGYQALRSVLGAVENCAFGEGALTTATASNNDAFGYYALNLQTTGVGNTAFGGFSLESNTGSYNAAHGYYALNASTTASYNAAFGAYAMYTSTTGQYNSGLGNHAMYSLITGSNNVGVGYQVAGLLTSGGNNTAIGFQAGYPATAANSLKTASNTVFFGYETGFGSSTQNNYAGAIGSQAVVYAANLIVVGSQNGVNGATATVGLATPGGIAVGYTNQTVAPGVGTFVAYGSTSGSLTQAFAAVITSYTITWPSAVANGTNYVLVSDATGALSWIAPASIGVSWSSLTNPSTNLSLAMGGFNTTFTNVGTWAYNSSAATSGTTTVNSLNFDILGSFWNGTSAVPYGGRLIWETDTVGPTGHWSFNLNNNGSITEICQIKNDGTLVLSNNVSSTANFTVAGTTGIPTVIGGTSYSVSGASQTLLKAFSATSLVVLGTDSNKRLQLDGNGSFGGVTTKNNTLDDGIGGSLFTGIMRVSGASQIHFDISSGSSNAFVGNFGNDVGNIFGFSVAGHVLLSVNGSSFAVLSANNTLDDGSGNITGAGYILANTFVRAQQVNPSITASTDLLQGFGSGVSVLKTDANKFLALDPNASFGGVSNTIFGGVAATSVATTKNSNYTEWQGHYWNGSASVLYGGRLQWTQDATTPTGHFSFNLNNNGTITEVAKIDQSGSLWALAGVANGTNQVLLRAFSGNDTFLYTDGAGILTIDTSGISAAMRLTGGNLKLDKLISYYNSIVTAGGGVPSIYGTVGLGVNLNTTATQITTYVAGSTGFYSVRIAISCKTSSTVALTISYTDPQAGTITAQQIYSKALTGGTTDSFEFNMWCSSGATITLNGTDSVALGDAYASAQVEQLQ